MKDPDIILIYYAPPTKYGVLNTILYYLWRILTSGSPKLNVKAITKQVNRLKFVDGVRVRYYNLEDSKYRIHKPYCVYRILQEGTLIEQGVFQKKHTNKLINHLKIKYGL